MNSRKIIFKLTAHLFIGKPERNDRDACIELRGIADTEERSSYQDLEAAVEAERKAKKAQYLGHVGETSSDVEEPLFDLSAEAYSNAEQMLKELLERDNEAKRGDKP